MYIDLLTQIKNAQMAKKEGLKVQYSANDERVLEILQSRGFIDSFDKKGRGPKKVLSIKVKYEDNKGAITGVRFVSKPSHHLYRGYRDIRPVKSGRGALVISTPEGIMTGDQARRQKLGGEPFFEIW